MVEHEGIPAPTVESPGFPGRDRGLHPAVQVGWIAGRFANALVLGGMVGFAETRLAQSLPLHPPLLATIAFGAILVLGLVHSRFFFRTWRWALRDDDVFARFGVVWRVTRSIPRVRVQHVDIRSGPIDRALGLVEVSLHVAGSTGPVVTIPGLHPMEAETLREALLGSAKVP